MRIQDPTLRAIAEKSRRHHRLALDLMLFAGLFGTGCAANTPKQGLAEKTQPYYQDAQLCRAKSPDKTLASGEDPAAHVDEAAYLKCMKQAGYQQEAKTDPLLAALKRCQKEGTKTVSASGEQGLAPPTPTAVRSCLKSRGFPSTGEAPAAKTSSMNGSQKRPEGPESAPSSSKDSVQTVIIPKRIPGVQ